MMQENAVLVHYDAFGVLVEIRNPEDVLFRRIVDCEARAEFDALVSKTKKIRVFQRKKGRFIQQDHHVIIMPRPLLYTEMDDA